MDIEEELLLANKNLRKQILELEKRSTVLKCDAKNLEDIISTLIQKQKQLFNKHQR